MTRKDYLLIAKAISTERQTSNALDEGFDVQRLLHQLCLKLEADNPMFNSDRFIKACYTDDN